VEKIDGPAKSIQEPAKGPRDEERDAFGAGEADGLGNQFADHYVQNRQKNESRGKRTSVSDHGGARSGNSVPQRAEKVCQSGFAEGAESEAGEGNSELHAGHDVVQVGDQGLDDLGADIALANKLADPGDAHGDEGELGGGEESVEDDEEQYADQANDEHAGREAPWLHCSRRN